MPENNEQIVVVTKKDIVTYKGVEVDFDKELQFFKQNSMNMDMDHRSWQLLKEKVNTAKKMMQDIYESNPNLISQEIIEIMELITP